VTALLLARRSSPCERTYDCRGYHIRVSLGITDPVPVYPPAASVIPCTAPVRTSGRCGYNPCPTPPARGHVSCGYDPRRSEKEHGAHLVAGFASTGPGLVCTMPDTSDGIDVWLHGEAAR
jgi:hypothetical protein